MRDLRRSLARVPVEKLANELIGNHEQLGLVTDLSEAGLHLTKRSLSRRQSSIIQLEFAIPEVNEIIWAKGEVCFDRLLPNMLRSTGVRFISAAQRHMRMLRDWVMSAVEAREQSFAEPLLSSAHFRD